LRSLNPAIGVPPNLTVSYILTVDYQNLERGCVVTHIGYVHHVGHVVRDMDAALALYRRMGFRVPPPTFPALPSGDGGRRRVVGAGNTHVTFRRNFLELVTVLDGEPGPDVVVAVLDVPAEALARVTDGITATTTRISSVLDRFEGLHILVFQTPNADGAAARPTAEGVAHGGVLRVRRPGGDGDVAVPIGVIEIDGDAGRTPEGRLAVAEDLPDTAPDHPNGALDLVGPVLCVPASELAVYEHRYTLYLGRAARIAGSARIFDLDGCAVTLVAEPDLGTLLPGERAPSLPAFVGYVVTVGDLSATTYLLEEANLPVRDTPHGDAFVPAAAALGTAVIFRQGATSEPAER
jgi:hypothetical protein